MIVHCQLYLFSGMCLSMCQQYYVYYIISLQNLSRWTYDGMQYIYIEDQSKMIGREVSYIRLMRVSVSLVCFVDTVAVYNSF